MEHFKNTMLVMLTQGIFEQAAASSQQNILQHTWAVLNSLVPAFKAQIDQLQQALPNCNITHNRKENGSPAVVPNVPAGKSQQWTYGMGQAENDIEKIYDCFSN